MRFDSLALMDAVELVAAGSWGVEAASRALQNGDVEGARGLLEDLRDPLADGLQRLATILNHALGDPLTKPEHLAREVMASIAELRGRMDSVDDDDGSEGAGEGDNPGQAADAEVLAN
jgi:hypothetical protein